MNLYNRANHFRRQNEFDKAIGAYERILEQDDTDAEAHWGAVLSRYGIEYVEDPTSHARIPTCHRVQPTSILTDPDYLSALEYAPDDYSRSLYEQEAKHIADIQRGILAISAQEKPYDVFICYKETTDAGIRTKDSTLAQDIYYQLNNAGYKVFFARITLEDKLGQQYEPYIFAALNSAKVMLVIGTKPEFFNAVWVRNEWSRFLALMKDDRNKLLIPCYRDMDPYDLPEELSSLQSQDMSKIGFMQDVIRGVKKVLDAGKQEKQAPGVSQTQAGAAPSILSFLTRAQMFLEDGDWDSAGKYAEKILDIDPKCAQAYIVKLCVSRMVKREGDLVSCDSLLEGDMNYKKAIRFADDGQKKTYKGYNDAIKSRLALEGQCHEADESYRKARQALAGINNELEALKSQNQVLLDETVRTEHELENTKGAFKGKQKKRLQELIDSNYARIGDIEKKITDIEAVYTQKKEAVDAAESEYSEKVYSYAKLLCDARLYDAALSEYRIIAGYKDVNDILNDTEFWESAKATKIDRPLRGEVQSAVSALPSKGDEATDPSALMMEVESQKDGINRKVVFEQAVKAEQSANTEQEYLLASRLFERIPNFRDSNMHKLYCEAKAEAKSLNDQLVRLRESERQLQARIEQERTDWRNKVQEAEDRVKQAIATKASNDKKNNAGAIWAVVIIVIIYLIYRFSL